MNCILTAYEDHLRYLGLEISLERYIYWGVRQAALVKGGEYTPGATVPLIYTMMAAARGLELTIQSRRGTKEFYLECLEDRLQREIVKISNFGEEVDRVEMYPAIWCMMNVSHAAFSSYPPELNKTVIEMAFQFRIK